MLKLQITLTFSNLIIAHDKLSLFEFRIFFFYDSIITLYKKIIRFNEWSTIKIKILINE